MMVGRQRRGRSAPPSALREALLPEMKDEKEMLEIREEEKDDERTTPFLKKLSLPLITLCVALFANSYALANPVPYAPFMVLSYGVVETKEETGFYAGMIMSSFMFGRFLSSFVCGRLADNISYKFVIRLGLLSCLLFQIGFGIAPTYVLALTSRLLMGFFNGILGAARAMLPTLFPPAEQAAAMSLVTAMWNLGQIVGTAVGGLLAGYPKSHPYLVANAFGSGLAAIAVFAVEIWIPGKLRKRDHEKSSLEEPLLVRIHQDDDDDTASTTSIPPPPKKKGGLRLVPRASWPPTVIYAAFSLLVIMFEEAYPLFLLTSKEDGGYAMSSGDIGIVMSATACFGIALQIFAFPVLARIVPSTVLFRRAVTLCAALALVPPMITKAGLRKDPTFVALIAHRVAYQFCMSAGFTSLCCCVNNSCAANVRGTVNGVGMATSSVLMAIGPTAGGALYSWSLATSVLPKLLKGRFVFVLTACLYLLSAASGAIFLGHFYDVPVDEVDSKHEDDLDKDRPMVQFDNNTKPPSREDSVTSIESSPRDLSLVDDDDD